MKQSLLATMAAVLLLTVCSTALALTPENSGLYVGLNAGYGQITQHVPGSIKQDNSGLTGGADIGYQFNQFVSTEAGFTMYSNQHFDNHVVGDNNYMINLALKVSLPFTPTFNIFAKAGFAGVHHRLHCEDCTTPSELYECQMRPTFFGGLGINYAVTKQIGVNLQATGTTKNGSVTPQMYSTSIGVSYTLPKKIAIL